MGNWMMFSLLFRNLHIPLAEGIAIWPPDGVASPGGGIAATFVVSSRPLDSRAAPLSFFSHQ